jgi:hypothetical protein
MTDIIDRIDAAVGCQQCGGPLGASPSDDFCGEDCQSAWRRAQVGAEDGAGDTRPAPVDEVFSDTGACPSDRRGRFIGGPHHDAVIVVPGHVSSIRLPVGPERPWSSYSTEILASPDDTQVFHLHPNRVSGDVPWLLVSEDATQRVLNLPAGPDVPMEWLQRQAELRGVPLGTRPRSVDLRSDGIDFFDFFEWVWWEP